MFVFLVQQQSVVQIATRIKHWKRSTEHIVKGCVSRSVSDVCHTWIRSAQSSEVWRVGIGCVRFVKHTQLDKETVAAPLCTLDGRW